MIQPGFTGGTLDRADHLRHDDAAILAAKQDARARLIRMSQLMPELDGEGRLVWDSLAVLDEEAEAVLLGLDAGIPCFAAVRDDDPVITGRAFALFGLLARMPDGEAANYAVARSLVDWHSRHRFCAVCGTKTAILRAGWARKCPGCGAEHFPRTDPVVIMLAERGDLVLLGRGKGWPEGRFSALAGFCEVGESIEDAVAREIFEEAGVRVSNIRYVASQPWPFPSSLMIAAVATAEGSDLIVDRTELDAADWFSRADVRAALSDDVSARFIAPPRYAIAHTLLTRWADGDVIG